MPRNTHRWPKARLLKTRVQMGKSVLNTCDTTRKTNKIVVQETLSIEALHFTFEAKRKHSVHPASPDNTERTVCNITDASDDTSDDADKFYKDAKSKRATTCKQTEGSGPKHPRQAQELRSEKLRKGKKRKEWQRTQVPRRS